ncbi:hypothetical protein LUZ63_002315 [Rhynchospora breviuscula]|uniref:Uncharacterized protein n=1 Tax=Rhynchospora breviuscula TaxID=2022672 RepID=A0A9Q0HXX5_9POAL|nr:hypothetical protein LUZ63_002315 [Rhynchospora breviuscula]
MQSVKEKTSNAAASAKAGMEKTKASVDEKVEKMKTRDPMEKAAAEEHKEERKMAAEAEKQAEKHANAAQRGYGTTTGTATGIATGRPHTGGTGGFGSSV